MTHRPTPSAQPLDRRVQRTRDALREALMALMVERGWDAIDVQTLCERANIGRSTFYQHYPNKEDLLKANFEMLRQILLAQAGAGPVHAGAVPAQAGPLAFVPGLVTHVHEAQQVFRALIGRRSGQYVQDRFRELMVQLVLAATPAPKARGWQAQAQAHYLGGALFELLAWWLTSNRAHKPQDIAALFQHWSRQVLEAPPLR